MGVSSTERKGRAVSFDTVLVANRGEIAVRVIRTAAAQGYRTAAVYSDADADAPHVRLADIAVPIGPAPARESYLDIARLIGAAERAGERPFIPVSDSFPRTRISRKPAPMRGLCSSGRHRTPSG